MTSDELRQEIEQTRQRLGETVDELAAKADMKARARAVRRYWPAAALVAAGLLMAGSAIIWRWRQA